MAPINPPCLSQAAIHCKIKTYRGSAADKQGWEDTLQFKNPPQFLFLKTKYIWASRVVADRLAALTKDLEDEEVLDSELLEEERMELNTYARRY